MEGARIPGKQGTQEVDLRSCRMEVIGKDGRWQQMPPGQHLWEGAIIRLFDAHGAPIGNREGITVFRLLSPLLSTPDYRIYIMIEPLRMEDSRTLRPIRQGSPV